MRMNGNEPIDQKVVTELRELMGDAYLTVYEAFLRSGEQNMSDLAAAVADNKLENIKSITHTLKGSSANIGAKRLSEISMEMMEDARNSMVADYHSYLANMQQEFKRVCDMIETFSAV